LIAGTKTRLERWMQVQHSNHRGRLGKGKFDLEFGQDLH
jgi:hypothetical protein